MERLTEKIEDRYIERQERLSNGKIVGTKMCLKKLGELEDLEEQGLLLRLPCKVGERVYTVSYNYECDCDYDCVEIANYKCEEGIPCEHMVQNYFVKETTFCVPMIDVLGKRVFRTKEEAEAALEEKNNANR